MRKAQAAMEFLMTYGWAILALLVAVGALTYFSGGFKYALPASCTVPAPLVCMEYKAATDGTITLGFQNGGDDLLEVTISLLCDDDPTRQQTFTQEALPSLARLNGTTIHFDCSPVSGVFRGVLNYTYRNTGESSTHYAHGSVRLPVES